MKTSSPKKTAASHPHGGGLTKIIPFQGPQTIRGEAFVVRGKTVAIRYRGRLGATDLESFCLVDSGVTEWRVNGEICGLGPAGEAVALMAVVAEGLYDGVLTSSESALRLVALKVAAVGLASDKDEALALLSGDRRPGRDGGERATTSGAESDAESSHASRALGRFVRGLLRSGVIITATAAVSLLASCGEISNKDQIIKISVGPDIPKTQTIDERLLPYVTSFVEDCLRYRETKISCDLSLVKKILIVPDGDPVFPNENIIGLAQTYYNGDNVILYHTIHIRNSVVSGVSFSDDKNLNGYVKDVAYHELGHTLGMGHVDSKKSIMDTFIINYGTENEMEEKIRELFSDAFFEEARLDKKTTLE
jgi:predicted Zn-dependent protease